jgi:glucose/arabinose dehydrogenase
MRHPDGRDLRVVARGLRNPYGLAVDRKADRLYASVNERDAPGGMAFWNDALYVAE